MTREEKIEEFLSELETELDLDYIINAEDVNSYDDIYDAIERDGGFDIEIIYYNRAIEYLSENDPSLQESMEIAHEVGFGVDNLNSEVLASLLASQNVRVEFDNLRDEIDEFFDELEDDEEEDDDE